MAGRISAPGSAGRGAIHTPPVSEERERDWWTIYFWITSRIVNHFISAARLKIKRLIYRREQMQRFHFTCLPPCVHQRASSIPDHFMEPFPRLVINRLSNCQQITHSHGHLHRQIHCPKMQRLKTCSLCWYDWMTLQFKEILGLFIQVELTGTKGANKTQTGCAHNLVSLMFGTKSDFPLLNSKAVWLDSLKIIQSKQAKL